MPIRQLFDESARRGILLGLIFTCIIGAMFCSLDSALPGMCMFPLMLLVPVVLYISLTKVVGINPLYCRFAPIWMSGIIQFICGGLICAFCTALFLHFSDPSFLGSFLRRVLEASSEQVGLGVNPDLSRLVVPTRMEFVGSIFWTISFTGSVYSLLMGIVLPLVPAFRRKATPTF